MAGRCKLPKEVEEIFKQYQDSNVRRLKKEEALIMLEKEFNLGPTQAEQMFEMFDKDKNDIMSIWEFQQFYQIVGTAAADMVKKFEEMDVDQSGLLDTEEARKGLKDMVTSSGNKLSDPEIEFFINSSINEEKMIDLGQFASLLYRLKLHKGSTKK